MPQPSITSSHRTDSSVYASQSKRYPRKTMTERVLPPFISLLSRPAPPPGPEPPFQLTLERHTNSAGCKYLLQQATLAIKECHPLEPPDRITENSCHSTDQLAVFLRSKMKVVVDYAVEYRLWDKRKQREIYERGKLEQQDHDRTKKELSATRTKVNEVFQRLKLSEARNTDIRLEQQQEIINLASLLVNAGKEPLSCVRCRQSLSRVSDLEEHQNSATCIDQYEFQALYAFTIRGYTPQEVLWALDTFNRFLRTPIRYHMIRNEKNIFQQIRSGTLREEWTGHWIDTMGRKEPRFLELYRRLRKHFPKPEEGQIMCLMCPQCFRMPQDMWNHARDCHRGHELWNYFYS